MKKSKIIFAFILLMSIISNFIFTSSMNAKAIEMDEYLISKSKKATPLDENLQTTVTLSLPSVDETSCINCVDIVFVMDDSTSTTNAGIDFSVQVKELVETLIEKKIDVKIGIIKFKGTANDAIDYASNGSYSKLVRYDETTSSIIKDAIEAKPENSRGTNLHAGLQLADKWLEEDKDVIDSKKNVVVLTDGRSYIWNDDAGKATTFYAQYPNPSGLGIVDSGMPAASQSHINSKYDNYSSYKSFFSEQVVKDKFILFTDSYSGNGLKVSFDKLYNSDNSELKESIYDTNINWEWPNWGPLGSGTVTAYPVSNISTSIAYFKNYYEFKDTSLDTSIKWLESNPYKPALKEDGTLDLTEDGKVKYTDEFNDNYIYFHPSSLEKGIYKAAHLYSEMNEKYIMSIIYTTGSSRQILNLSKEFNEWMAETSENKAYISKNSVSEDYYKIFDNIKNDSTKLITKGIVTDVIGKDFDLVESENPFILTIEDEELTSTKISDNVWGFGEKDETGEYPYKVTYDPEKEEFVWDISVPVEAVKHVKLSYTLKLVNVPTEEGTYEFDTNEKACLKYSSIYSEENDEECFEKPKVQYVVEPVIEYTDIEVTKVWEDNNNNDGKRPDSVTINLLKDGKEKVDSITLSKDTWKGTFKDVPISKGKETYKYTVSEEGVSGYDNPEITGSVEEKSFTITNKHTDEVRDIKVVKYWMETEENNNRPATIVINLLANGSVVDSVEVSGDASEKWEYIFTNKPVYKGGKEIAYTITENKVDGYEDPVYETEEDALVVKNIFDTSKGGEEVDPSPKTGDSIIQMIVTLFVSIVGLTMAIVVYRKENN